MSISGMMAAVMGEIERDIKRARDTEQNGALDELKKTAQESGVFEAAVQIIQLNPEHVQESGKIAWENCTIEFKNLPVINSFEGIPGTIPGTFDGIVFISKCSMYEPSIIITMPDGTCIFEATHGADNTIVFRKGKWVERLKAYAGELYDEKLQALEAAAKQARQAKLKPFSDIDF